MFEEEDREAVTAMVKADLIDEALNDLSRNIAGDPYYEDHIALFIRRVITAFIRYVSPKSKAHFYDLMTKED